MFGICARRTILVVAMLFAFTTVGEAAPSDWSDIVDPSLIRPARTSRAPQRVSTTTKAKTRASKARAAKAKKMRAAKRSAAKAKAKPRGKGKRRR